MSKTLLKAALSAVKEGRLIDVIMSGKIGKQFAPYLQPYSLFITGIATNLWHSRNGKNRYQLSDIDQAIGRTIVKEAAVTDESLLRIADAFLLAKTKQKEISRDWSAGGEWEGIVAEVFGEMSTAIEKRDLNKMRELLNDFTRSQLSLGLSLVGDVPKNYAEKIDLLNAFNSTRDVWKRITDNIPEDQLSVPLTAGNPVGVTSSTGRVIPLASYRHSYYAERITNLLRPATDATILEIGGGYGGVGIQLMAQTKCKVRWIDIDLPEICALSTYFVMATRPDLSFLLYGEKDLTPENITSADVIILPTFAIKDVPSGVVSLVFNAHSLSEMDFSTVKNYITEINRISGKFFLHANHESGYEYLALDGKSKYHVNLNMPEFELPDEGWLKLYRHLETIQNCRPGSKDFYEYLYMRKH